MFPLPLTPFERYYWHDDRPAYPTSYAFELSFEGELDRPAFEAALAAVWMRHPLLQARIEDGPRGPQWIAGDGQPPAVDWGATDAPIRHADGARIDLALTAGLRAWVRAGDGKAHVRLQFHHACADGLAALQLIEELLLAYDQLAADPSASPVLPPLEPQLLAERVRLKSDAEIAAETCGKKIRDAVATIREWSQHVLRPAVPLAVPADAAGEPDDDPVLGFITVALSDDLLIGLREAARTRGATWNDLLLAEFLTTLAEWNDEHGGRAGTLRINVPVSLRGARDAALPACNRLGFAFVSAHSRQCRGAGLIDAVREQTQRIKRDRLAWHFLGGLECGFQIPGLVPRLLQRDACFATACLSNVGRIWPRTPLAKNAAGQVVAGGATLVRIGAAPPVRPLTRVALAVLHYGSEVIFNLRVDPHGLSRQDGLALLQAYLDRLRAVGAVTTTRLPALDSQQS